MTLEPSTMSTMHRHTSQRTVSILHEGAEAIFDKSEIGCLVSQGHHDWIHAKKANHLLKPMTRLTLFACVAAETSCQGLWQLPLHWYFFSQTCARFPAEGHKKQRLRIRNFPFHCHHHKAVLLTTESHTSLIRWLK